MKIKILLFSIILGAITQASEHNMVAWGTSARANGNIRYDGNELIFEQEDTSSYAAIDGGHFFGVFDGHGNPSGPDRVCDMLKDDLHNHFEKTKGSIEHRMNIAFQTVETQATMHNVKTGFNSSGSTAVAVYIKDNKPHITHVGDSRALLFPINGFTHNIIMKTNDHKFTDATTLERLKQMYGEKLDHKDIKKNADGTVVKVRRLAMSTSIGDPNAKGITKTTPLGNGAIIATPEHTTIPDNIFDPNSILVIATDGLWDFISNDEVIAFITDAMNKSIEELRQTYSANPVTTHMPKNRMIRNAVRWLMVMSEEDWDKTIEFKTKPWNIIAEENNISIEDVRVKLNMTEDDFNTTFPLTADRTPLCDDLIEEKHGETIVQDEKCMLIARALSSYAIEKKGSRDNICITIVDLSQPYSFRQIMNGWWYFLSPIKKNLLRLTSLSLATAIIGILYCKLVR